MLAEQLAAAGRKSGGQFASKEAGAVREAEVEEAVPDDEEPFQCDPAWFEGAEAVAWTKTDSAHTCLCCGKADCECVWSQRDIEANLATLDEHCAQHFTEDEDWSLQDWAAFTGRGPQQQEAAANEQRKRKTGWQQAEQARQEGGRRQGRRGSSKTLDQFGFTQTAAAAPVPVTVVDTSDEETDDGAAQLPLHCDRDCAELQRLLEDGVSCAKARGDWRDHLRCLATAAMPQPGRWRQPAGARQGVGGRRIRPVPPQGRHLRRQENDAQAQGGADPLGPQALRRAPQPDGGQEGQARLQPLAHLRRGLPGQVQARH